MSLCGNFCDYWYKCTDINTSKCDRCENKKHRSYFKEIKPEGSLLSEKCLADIDKLNEKVAAMTKSIPEHFDEVFRKEMWNMLG